MNTGAAREVASFLAFLPLLSAADISFLIGLMERFVLQVGKALFVEVDTQGSESEVRFVLMLDFASGFALTGKGSPIDGLILFPGRAVGVFRLQLNNSDIVAKARALTTQSR